MWYLGSSLPANISVGCASFGCALGAAGTVTRRFVLGVAPLSPLASIRAYAIANGMLAGGDVVWPLAPYQTIREKLEASAGGQDLLRQAFAAPLLKLDAIGVGLPFAAYASSVLPLLPAPALLHICAFSRCGAPSTPGFDCNYPDLLPPATVFGGSCDLQAMMLEASRRGFLTMPYSNPTWWDVRSPTLANLSGAELAAVAALNASLLPIFETYADKPVPRSGVVVSPWSPFVRARLVRELQSLSWNASGSHPPASPCAEASAALPSSFVFEDQVGARFPPTDFSPLESGRVAPGYEAGLLAHSAAHAAVGLHTEQGFDRLARSLAGFHGSALQYIGGGGSAPFGPVDVTWRPEPLFAASGLRALVLNYQHNLDGSAMAADVPRLCWSLAMGFHLSLDVGNAAALANVAWTRTVAAFQRAAARFADYSATASTLGSDGTGSRRVNFSADALTPPLDPFYSPSYGVVWDYAAPAAEPITLEGTPGAARGPSTLAHAGCTAFGARGDVIAGLYSALFNGGALAAGAHAIIVDATCALLSAPPALMTTLCVWHPLGADTDITVTLPDALQPPAQLRVVALGAGDAVLGSLPFSTSSWGDAVTFATTATVHGEDALVFVVTLA